VSIVKSEVKMINHYQVIRTFIKETGQEKGTVSAQMAMASLSWIEKIDAAQQGVRRKCEGHVGGSDVKEWICQTCGLPIL
jgi:hypothetical protein